MKYIFLILIFTLNLYSNNEFLEFQKQRVYKKIIKNKLYKINTIHSYIQNHILRFGSKMPLKLDLKDDNPELTDEWWPKSIDIISKDIDFDIDKNNSIVKYKYLFNNNTASYMLDLIKTSRGLSQDAVVDENFTIIIPLSYEVTKLLHSLSQVDNLNIYGYNVSDASINAKCDLDNNAYQDKTVYIANGTYEYELRYCDNSHIKFEYLPLHTNKLIKHSLSSINNFDNNYTTKEIYLYETNTSNAYIYVNNNLLRIKK